jgi:uncharacterized membrane protein
MGAPFSDPAERALVDRYLNASNRAKYRRLAGLVAMSIVLVAVLIVIYAMGWTNFDTAHAGHDSGAGWIIVGIAVGIVSIAGVVIDIYYRRDV